MHISEPVMGVLWELEGNQIKELNKFLFALNTCIGKELRQGR